MEMCGSILEAIGNTPLVDISRMGKGYSQTILCKLEYMNPGLSVKDRVGLSMIEDGEKKGLIKPGGTIIEGTSGNTGVGLAMAAVIKGYSCIFVMPDKMSQEKIDNLKAYGAEVIVTPTAVEPEDPRSYYSVSQRLSEEIPNSYYPNQYSNPSNPEAHYRSTGPELWRQTDGKIYAFVAGMGTGGTLSGVGKYLKEQNPDVKIIGVDPVGSIYYDFFHSKKVIPAQTYKVEGIGEDFFPSTMDLDILDDVIQVTDKDCFVATRKLARKEGIFTGGSGGGAVIGAFKWLDQGGVPDDAIVVVLLPDTGARYLSKAHSEAWLRENRFIDAQVDLTAKLIIDRKIRFQTQGSHVIPKLLSVTPTTPVMETLAIMKEYEISQLPVIDDSGNVVGSVRDDRLIHDLVHSDEAKEYSVSKLMDEPFPIIAADTHIEKLSEYITKDNPAVLLELDGSYQIITKADILASISG